MTITERTLIKWRKEALNATQFIDYSLYNEGAASLAKSHRELSERILRLTQELLDQHLIRKVSR